MVSKRVNMQFDDEILAQIDEYASKLHVSRSACINVIISQFFDNRKAMSAMSDIAGVMNSNPELFTNANK